MTKVKKLVSSAVIAAVFFGMVGLSGCSGVSEEQMAQLEALRKEVNQMTTEINDLKSQKSKLERMVAEREALLEKCANKKAETQKNLNKMGK